MFNLIDMIRLQMKKNGIKTDAELVQRLNELNDGKTYYKQHLSDIMNGNNAQVPYLYGLEKVFGLPENALVRMIDLSKVTRKLIRNGGK